MHLCMDICVNISINICANKCTFICGFFPPKKGKDFHNIPPRHDDKIALRQISLKISLLCVKDALYMWCI